ncbi:hypothetical protein YDYSY3_47680 [Paenibacillus chitinolyticus]|nr:hypothetical protein YDYSY3_47680 [Paenibacillus chitinolyticus]
MKMAISILDIMSFIQEHLLVIIELISPSSIVYFLFVLSLEWSFLFFLFFEIKSIPATKISIKIEWMKGLRKLASS